MSYGDKLLAKMAKSIAVSVNDIIAREIYTAPDTDHHKQASYLRQLRSRFRYALAQYKKSIDNDGDYLNESRFIMSDLVPLLRSISSERVYEETLATAAAFMNIMSAMDGLALRMNMDSQEFEFIHPVVETFQMIYGNEKPPS